MANRPRHPNKEIEAAVRYGEDLGWRLEMSNGHAWGRLYCPHHDRGGCIVSIWSTPRDGNNHARRIRTLIDKCNHGGTDE
jgi:hypothetical protein